MDRREQRFKKRTAVTKEQALNFLCANEAAEQNREAHRCCERNSNGITQEQGEKAQADAVYCYSTYTMQVNDQYSLQFGNETLTSDNDQAIVDCLHKQGVAPASYTKEQFKNDVEERRDRLASGDDSASPQDASASANEESAYHIDFDDPNASECLVANGWSYDNGLKTEWRPLG